MTIQIGDRIPHAVLNVLKDGVQAVSTDDVFAGKKVVLFSVPGAFSMHSRHAVSTLHAWPSTMHS
jgi:peroxiredoxin